MKKQFIAYSILFIIYGCAKIGHPTGGPKDVTPPEVIKSIPENNTTDFDGRKIVISFNEYIKLENAYQEIIVSPPMKKTPLPIVRNKNAVIELNEELKDSTTYTINFGNSIVDNNEGNPLANFEFTFSTGDKIDSMSVMGQVLDAFTLKSLEEQVYIMLFDNLYDSVPLKEKPMYVGRSRSKGVFAINNIKTGRYKIFALADMNSNLIFDSYEESIGFIDSTFFLHPDIIKQNDIILEDSVFTDSIINIDSAQVVIQDSIMIDSIPLPVKEYALFVNMKMFKEKNTNQYLTSYKREIKEKAELFFNIPLIENRLTIEPLNFNADQSWFLEEKNITNDTISLWLTDTTLINNDTLMIIAGYMIKDSLQNNIMYNDTLKFIYYEKDAKKPKRKKEEEKQEQKEIKNLIPSFNIKRGSAFDLNKPIRIKTGTPTFEYDPGKVELLRYDDTLEIPVKSVLIKDTLKLKDFNIINDWEENTKYKLTLYPGALTDIYGTTNDTLTYDFSTKSEGDYGILFLNITNCNQPVIIQLLNENENVILEEHISENSKIEFHYLLPKVYILKAIYDKNKNKKWDTGNYLKKIQPEKVRYFRQKINVRSNWEIEMDWELE